LFIRNTVTNVSYRIGTTDVSYDTGISAVVNYHDNSNICFRCYV